MKPKRTGDVQALPLGSQVVTALQGRPVSAKTPPTGASLVWNGSAWTPGGRIAHGINGTSVSTSGTSFAAGADLLGTALKFTADGSSSYIIRVEATDWTNTTAGEDNIVTLNFDGSDAGIMAILTIPGNSYSVPLDGQILITPAAGNHTVNVRLYVLAPGGGTATVNAGAGGGSTRGPILVTLEVA